MRTGWSASLSEQGTGERKRSARPYHSFLPLQGIQLIGALRKIGKRASPLFFRSPIFVLLPNQPKIWLNGNRALSEIGILFTGGFPCRRYFVRRSFCSQIGCDFCTLVLNWYVC